ncbi:NTPase [candidate division KSB1 bacterium]
MNNILITGKPGIGKTTVIRKIIEKSGKRIGGFFTEEIREKGIRTGFLIKDLNGNQSMLSHCGIQSPCRVGKYGVNVEAIDSIGVSAVRSALENDEIKIIIIDEIAKMELFSKRFQSAVTDALNAPKSVLGTLQDKNIFFINNLRERKDVSIITITLQNRETIFNHILEII